MGEDRRAAAREKRGGRREKRGREAGVLRWREPSEIDKISQQFVIFGNRNGTKRREPLRKRAESGSKRYGMRE